MKKNQYGQPFMSVLNFSIPLSQTVIPIYDENGKITSKGYIAKKNRLHYKKADKKDIIDNVQNMHTWGFKTSLNHDLFVGKYGAVVDLIENEMKTLEELFEKRPDLKELSDNGYKFYIGPGFDISDSTGKVKPKQKFNQKPTYKALYCTNFKEFLSKDISQDEFIPIYDKIEGNTEFPSIATEREETDFIKNQEIYDMVEKESKRRK